MVIYVGNVAYETPEEEIKGLFEEFGAVSSIKMIVDKETGKPKGFGFIEMDDDEHGKAAVEALDGKEMNERKLRVMESKPKPRGGGGGGGFKPRGGRGGHGGGGPRGGGGGGRFNRDNNRGGGRYNNDRGDRNDRGARSEGGENRQFRTRRDNSSQDRVDHGSSRPYQNQNSGY